MTECRELTSQGHAQQSNPYHIAQAMPGPAPPTLSSFFPRKERKTSQIMLSINRETGGKTRGKAWQNRIEKLVMKSGIDLNHKQRLFKTLSTTTLSITVTIIFRRK
jgi:hypothetical protein